MRVQLLTIIAIAAAAAAAPAQAQTYDPNFPVCLHIYGKISYYDCSYTSLAQCNASAAGRSALCDVNPYFAHASATPSVRRYKRHRGNY